MAGRKRVFTIWPLTFDEFLTWKNPRVLEYYTLGETDIQQMTPELMSLINNEFVEFIRFGGYPGVVLAHNQTDKQTLLKELIDSYLLRDIQLLHYRAEPLQIQRLLTMLASMVSSLLDIPTLAQSIGLKRGALVNRLDLLQQTFILHTMAPYYTNKVKELTKNPKVYLVDTGLRNTLLQHFELTPHTQEFGNAVENTVMTELYKHKDSLTDIYYWRTKNKQEVDFVVKHENTLVPFEVKSGTAVKVPSPLQSFIRMYHPKNAVVLNWSRIETVPYEDTNVYFRPLWWQGKVALT